MEFPIARHKLCDALLKPMDVDVCAVYTQFPLPEWHKGPHLSEETGTYFVCLSFSYQN